MRYVVYHAETGLILRHGHCPAEDIAHQEVPDGHAVLALADAHPAIDDRRHRVERGAVVDRPPDAPALEQQVTVLRRARNHRLAASDWTQLPDVPLAVEKRLAWAAYRQALRDLPAVTRDPANPAWPQPPQ